MARTATLGVGAFLLSVVFVLVSLWWIPDSARAAEPIPGPVDEIADIPTRTVKALTGSPMGNAIAGDMLKAQNVLVALGRAQAGGGLATAAPKPITAPTAFARAGAVGAGSVLTAFMGAWALGSNGSIALIAAGTGSTYDKVFCQQPGWYQGTTSFINMGFAPDCTAMIPQPNVDITPGMGLTYGAVNVKYIGLGANNSYCYSQNQPLPSGYNFQFHKSGGTAQYGTTLPSWSGACPSPQYYVYISQLDSASSISVRGPSGTTVATMQQTDTNPTRTARCRITWEDGSVTTGTGSSYKESTGLPLTAAGLGCEQAYVSKPGRGPALLPDKIEVESETGGAITEISEQAVPDFTPTERKAFETGNGRGLVLEKVIGAAVTSCMTWEANCVGWWEKTQSGTQPSTGTETYRCTYAGQVIDLAECGPYRHTFDTRTATPTITDPVTGGQTEWSAQPNTGNSLNPGVGPGTGANPAAECFQTGWSEVANPVDWVMVPVKCALVWAFVPRTQAVETQTTRTDQAWKETWPVKGMQAGLAAVAALQTFDLGGCEGPHVYWEISWPAPIVWDAHPLNACGPPYNFLALVSNVVISLLAIGYTVWGLTRRVGAVVGAPGLGPSS